MYKTVIKPGPGKIAVKPVANEFHTSSGLWVPESVTHEGHLGEVVAVSEAWMTDAGVRIDPDYKVGETVVFGKYNGTELRIERETYYILREADILASLERTPIEPVVADAQPG